MLNPSSSMPPVASSDNPSQTLPKQYPSALHKEAICSNPTAISLFITNLRLLGLDQFEDWPDIDEHTFSTKDPHQNQKNRLRCVEWALYRLFEIWDVELVEDKLQPFFPPLEPLQSLNLRTALFRCLNDLKKNGVFSRDIVLRKTMLDECKGDRFEEILLAFSTTVLHSIVTADGASPSPAMLVATSTILSPDQQKTLSAMILEDKTSLENVIREKEETQLKFSAFKELLDLHERRLSNKQDVLAEQAQSPSTRLSESQSNSLIATLNSTWLCSGVSYTALLNKPQSSTSSQVSSFDFLHLPFSTIFDAVRTNALEETIEAAKPHDPVADLSKRIRVQQGRLEMWREYGKKLADDTTKDGRTVQSASSFLSPSKGLNGKSRDKLVDFQQHLHLKPGWEPEADRCNESTDEDDGTTSKTNAPATGAIKSAAVENEYTRLIQQMDEDLAAVSRPRSGHRRVAGFDDHANRNDSFHRRRESSPRNRDLRPSRDGPPEQDNIPNSSTALSIEGGDSSCLPPPSRSVPSDSSSDPVFADSMALEDLPPPRCLSLADRTRKSMAFSSTHLSETTPIGDDDSILPLSPSPIPPLPANSTTFIEQTKRDMPLPTLVERTRKSISSLPTHSRRASKHPPMPSLPKYPTNQFETPRKTRRGGDGSDSEDEKTTPTEKLFEEQAEYDSVFKSRPRVGHSPRMDEAIWAENDESEERSSPLGRRDEHV